MGLAWVPDIEKDGRFITMVQNVKEIFKTL
jgi:hypothetical protein